MRQFTNDKQLSYRTWFSLFPHLKGWVRDVQGYFMKWYFVMEPSSVPGKDLRSQEKTQNKIKHIKPAKPGISQ